MYPHRYYLSFAATFPGTKRIFSILLIISLFSSLCPVSLPAALSPSSQKMLDDGINSYQAGKYTAALVEFNGVLLEDPGHPLAQAFVALIKSGKEQQDENPARVSEGILVEREIADPSRTEMMTKSLQEVSSRYPATPHIVPVRAPETGPDTAKEEMAQRINAAIVIAHSGYAREDLVFAEREQSRLEFITLHGRLPREIAIFSALERLQRGEPGYLLEKSEAATPERKKPLSGGLGDYILLSGEYRIGIGITSHDFLWKHANADYVGVPREKNYRYLWGQDRMNTYDPKIFSRFKLDIQTKSAGPWNSFAEVVADPWSFVGTKKVTVTSTAGGDSADITLKYWSNDSRTLNEIYRTRKGNIITLDQIKIVDGKTTPSSVTGLTDWFTTFNPIETQKIERDYRFLRKLWFDYRQDTYGIKFFPISDEYEALTTTDPLRLSNNHLYWEQSPWLDRYEPSRLFEHDDGTTPIKTGRWVQNLSFTAKDSDLNRLIFLRGIALRTYATEYPLEAVIATPMSLWDDYENSDTIDMAARMRAPAGEAVELGFTATQKIGLNRGSVEAINQVGAVDFTYQMNPALTAASYNKGYGEIAVSHTAIEQAAGFTTTQNGMAAKIGLDYNAALEKNEGIYKGSAYIGHMDGKFYPGLSNYRYTRTDDPTLSRHVSFSPVNPKDEAYVFGDGIDRGRNAVGFRVQNKAFMEQLETDIRYRNVHRDSGKYIETVTRMENTYKPQEQPRLTLKSLIYYKHLPKTTGRLDPLIWTKNLYSVTDYFAEEDTHPLNVSIADGKDPSIGAFDFGARYELIEKVLAVEGMYEITNDPLDFPRGLLNNNFADIQERDGYIWDKVVPFVYDQDLFGLPPYDYYNIAKFRLIYTPTDRWEYVFSGAYNENKYASGLDDNINHLGLEITHRPTLKWKLWFKYVYSMLYDLYEQITTRRKDFFDGHHNIFIGSEYQLDPDSTFTLLYGEYAGYDDPYQQSVWSLAALDTRHIVRLFYRRKF